MNKKVVVLGGGTGLSYLLRGLKQFPLSVTAIVSVCDDGRSTGRLREEFNQPAVGDIRQVLVALSETEPLVEDLLNYRFKTTSDLNGHTVGNLILTAMTKITGNMSISIRELSKVFNLKGKVVPFSCDNVILMGEMEDGTVIEGEHNITDSNKKIKRVFYKEKPKVTSDAKKAIRNADLIVLSMGSIFTSIIPNLICEDLIKEIDNSDAKIVYACNMFTQPGETDEFKASDHINLLNSYLGKKKISAGIFNNKEMDQAILKKYENEEQKDPVILDKENMSDIKIIEDDLVTNVNGTLKHDTIRLAFRIFEYLLGEENEEKNKNW